MKIPAISKFPHGWVISGKVKPRPRAMLWLMAVFLSVIAACGQEPKEGIAFKAMAKEVAKLRKQVDALSAKPSSVHFRFQNLMPATISDINIKSAGTPGKEAAPRYVQKGHSTRCCLVL